MKKAMLSEEALRDLLTTAETVTPEVEAKAPEQGEQTEQPEEKASEQVEMVAKEELVKLQGEFEAFKATSETAIKGLEEKLAAVEASGDGLKAIVINQITRMRLALGYGAMDLTKADAAAVVAEFNTTGSVFMEKMPVGSVVPQEKEKPAQAIQSSLDEGSFKALGFGHKN